MDEPRQEVNNGKKSAPAHKTIGCKMLSETKSTGMSTTIKRKNGFSVTTQINASPEALYRALTNKADLEGWLATEAEVDLRVDGKYIYRWPSPEGELSARGRYLELVPASKVKQTWESWGPEGRYADGDATLEVAFQDVGDGVTEMTQTEYGAAYAQADRLEMSINGTIEAHKTLAQYIKSKGL